MDWLTSAVSGLLNTWARDGMMSLTWHALPILADALEEGGYENRRVLEGMRAGELYRGDVNEFVAVLANPLLRDGDWQNVFAYAGEPEAGDGSASVGAVPPGSQVAETPFSRWDVADVLGTSEGANDEQNWLVYGQLKDGRFFFLTAGCDYTGWG